MNMYIFVNADLEMVPGRLAAQVGHIVQKIIEELMETKYETYPIPEHCFTYMKWKESPTKIILAATEAQLIELMGKLGARAFYDDCDQGIQLTAVGFLPGSISKKDTKKYRLI